jgi:hypothetical protein
MFQDRRPDKPEPKTNHQAWRSVTGEQADTKPDE